MNGIVLGSGSARGYAHIGVLKVTEEAGVNFDFVVGCSIGAVIGALYASGLNASELEKIALELKPTRLLRLVVPAKPSQAFLNSKKIEAFLREILPVRRFEDLRKPLLVVATSLSSGKLKVFSSGELLPAIMASISIPIIFPAVKIGNEFFVDGGVVSPLPVKVARTRFPESKILAIDLSATDKKMLEAIKKKESLSIYESALYSVILMQLALAERERNFADLVLTPNVSNFQFYEFYRQKEIIKTGELEAKKHLKLILSLFKGPIKSKSANSN